MNRKCPKCGSFKIKTIKPIKIGFLVSYYLVCCETCNHEFEIQKSD